MRMIIFSMKYLKYVKQNYSVFLPMPKSELLTVQNLNVSFVSKTRETKVLKKISFEVKANEIVAVVGESGSGKSITSLAIMGLLPKAISKITSGSILFNNQNLTELSQKSFKAIRGKDIAMVFQEPMSSLNPSMRCGKQVEEIIKQHTRLNSKEIKEDEFSLFEKVKLPNPVEFTKPILTKFLVDKNNE